MHDMDGHSASTDEMLQTLLVRTAVMQSQMHEQHEAVLAALVSLQEGQKALAAELVVLREAQTELRVSGAVVQAEVKALNEKLVYYATEAQVESVRTEVHKAVDVQTWRLLIWMTALSSGLAGAVYHIARYVH